MINPIIRREVQEKLEKIDGDSAYYNARQKTIARSLKTLGDIYSFWIENPGLRRELLLDKKSPETIKKLARKGIHNIKNAWYFLQNKGAVTESFINILDEELIKRTNKLVVPEEYGSGQFRTNDVTLNIPRYTPPSWERVPEKIHTLIGLVKGKYVSDPLESAIEAHLGIAAIQPFVEGNKRTARLVQNRILHSCGLPPVQIHAGEGTYYHGLLRKILPSYGEESRDELKPFFDYCASKVNSALDNILGDLKV